MSNSIHLISLLLLASGLSIHAQEKRAMTFDEMVGWERISEQRISDNGKWVFCKMEPWRGDATILLYNDKGEEKGSFKPAAKAQFSSSSEYLLVTKTPPLKEVEAEKLKKTDKDKMPMNSLIISRLSGGMETIDSLKSYKLSETADWLAYQRGSKKDSMLYIRSLDGMQQDSFPAVSDFGFAQKGNVLYVVSDSVLYTYIPQKGNNRISDKKGVFKKIAFNENGSKLAYLFCPHKDSAATRSSLYLAENNTPGKLIAERGDKAFPASWIISENAPLYFSENASRLFFGTAPEPKQKDTTLLAENRPDVQVWSWDEKVQYTQQSFNKATDLKRSYTAIYNLGSGRLLQLATEELPTLQTADEGNAIWALLSTTRPYGTQSMWTARQFHDIYIINLETGERRQIKEKSPSYMRFSPKGKYTYWYQDQDSSWYTRSTADGKEYRLTTPQTFAAWDEDNDVPDYPSPYGIAGWTDDDQSILIKDRYDIWKFDPIAASSPVNLTVNGRKEQITYSLIQLDREKRAYNTSEAQYLTGFNERTKGSGYYTTRLNKPVAPKALLAGNFKLAALAKAKDANAVIYTQETYEQYPDVQLSNLSFKKSIRLTDGIRQQDSIIWGTAELTSWISLDGRPLEGVIYKPADFDPNKKYPLIVYYYGGTTPTERGISNPYCAQLFASRDYVVYVIQPSGTIGFGQEFSARHVNAWGKRTADDIIEGTKQFCKEHPFVNDKKIGCLGASYGGFMTQYLQTQTDIFAAAVSHAGISNVTSYWGEGYWGYGYNAIAAADSYPWNNPELFTKQGSLFNADKINTPLLLLHGTVDTNVPIGESIQLFNALKILGKTVEFITVDGENHFIADYPKRVQWHNSIMAWFARWLQDSPQWWEDMYPERHL